MAAGYRSRMQKLRSASLHGRLMRRRPHLGRLVHCRLVKVDVRQRLDVDAAAAAAGVAFAAKVVRTVVHVDTAARRVREAVGVLLLVGAPVEVDEEGDAAVG
jgi:hypothetical protein